MDKKLSDSEQYVWDFIQENIQTIPNYSIIKLSELANVSTATIVRTMNRVEGK
ncbi:putative RpiR family transcriptional regulator [Tetragenococcus halophilus subsp. halophilus]|nr:putative RpiR family transcriptional regulator [Tetragenococcus halophilus subsp. halophilus]GBD82590.1 putative RpiR family transcriptional regulator [Tetragenococcus halophilus subsp. halophilus]